MASARGCKNDPNIFCYTCGEFTTKENRKPIDDFYRRAYHAYFQVKLGDQDKSWAPHIVCKTCKEQIRQWSNGTRKSLKFGIPMVWREPQNHDNDCYFCSIDATGLNNKKRKSKSYPCLKSAIRPVLHSSEVPIPLFSGFSLQDGDKSDDGDNDDDIIHDAATYEDVCFNDTDYEGSSAEPMLFDQNELSNLIRDLSLSKQSAELLASRLKEKNLLKSETRVTFYRNRDAEFIPLFNEDSDLVYCSNVEGVLLRLGVQEYDANSWRLFIDSSKRSLKCVLLHNTNTYAAIPIGHSTTLKEKHDSIKQVMEKINYSNHNWVICVDLKMVNFLLGQQSGFTKFPCFLCLWDSRARDQHWERKDWPL